MKSFLTSLLIIDCINSVKETEAQIAQHQTALPKQSKQSRENHKPTNKVI
jgi:hypothetical protein